MILVLGVLEIDKSWHNYFMHLAEESASRSKDPKTRVGACITKDKRVLSLGYNGAPRSFPDDEVPFDSDSKDLLSNKNAYMCHAELNAILNYRGSLSELDGATIYCTISPCNECLKALVQIGIKNVIYKEKYHRKDITMVTDIIAEKCNVSLMRLDDIV